MFEESSIDTDQPLSDLIVQLQQQYQAEDEESDMFRRMYLQANQLEDVSTTSKDVPKKKNKRESKAAKKEKLMICTNEESRHVIDPTVTDKKQIQMMRNRISAQNSRDRRKQYMSQLEEEREAKDSRITELENQVRILQDQLNSSQRIQLDENLCCLHCGSRSIGYEDEAPIMKKRNLGNLGFGLLVTMTIMAAFVIMMPTEQQSMMKQIDIARGFTETVVDTTTEQYQIIKALENGREKGTALMELPQTKTGSAVAILNYHKPDIQSLYCPSPYKYQKHLDDQIKITFTNGQWVQLIVPKDHINLFYRTLENQLIAREYQANQTNMSEVWCKVRSVNDLFI